MAAGKTRGTQYTRAYAYHTEGSTALNHNADVHHDTTRHVVYKPKPVVTMRQSVPMVVVIGIFLFILGFAALLQYAALTAASKQVSALDAKLAQMEADNEGLEVRIASADDPSRIRSVAVNRLNMLQPGEDQIRYLSLPDLRPSDHTLPQVPPKRNGLLNAMLRFLD
ncbi:MAG: septum formation initiator family protein [Clostridia bacterium]